MFKLPNNFSQSPLKYGSFPSLHVAWPTVIFLHQPWVNYKVRIWLLFCELLYIVIVLSCMYTKE